MPAVRFQKTHELATLPSKSTVGAAGYDITSVGTYTLYPGQHCVVDTGLKVAVPVGFEGQVRPRSGLAAKHGVTVLNAPGTIDQDYRGPLGVILINLGNEKFEVLPGHRVAQLVIQRVVPHEDVWLTFDANLDTTERGEGGFGSTGR